VQGGIKLWPNALPSYVPFRSVTLCDISYVGRGVLGKSTFQTDISASSPIIKVCSVWFGHHLGTTHEACSRVCGGICMLLRSSRMARKRGHFRWSTSRDVAPPILNQIARQDKHWLPLALAHPNMCLVRDLVQARPLEAAGPWDVFGRIWPDTRPRPYLRVIGKYRTAPKDFTA
jgi:hypothetical protein